MKSKNIILGTLCIFILVTAAYIGADGFAPKVEKNNYVIRWSMSHTPASYFTETAEKFDELIQARTNGRVKVEIIYPDENLSSDAKRKDRKSAYNHVRNGKIDMHQIYSFELAEHSNPTMNVFSMPFLFKNHRHIDAVVEGSIGKDLLKLASNNDVEAMAFTYSGGYMVMPSNGVEIHKYEDFRNTKVNMVDRIQDKMMIEKFGINSLNAQKLTDNKYASYYHQFYAGTADMVESTYGDILDLMTSTGPNNEPIVKVVNETRHFVLFTSLVINKKLLESMPEDLQNHVREVAIEAARYERRVVEKDEKHVKSLLQQKGYKIVKMSDSEIKRFQTKAREIYNDYGPEIKNFINRIQNTNPKNDVEITSVF